MVVIVVVVVREGGRGGLVIVMMGIVRRVNGKCYRLCECYVYD